jgi:hypothetical protein
MRNKKRTQSGTSLIELAPVLFCFFFLLIPLFDLICDGFACCVANCAAQCVTSETSKATSFNSCLSKMVDLSDSYMHGILPKTFKVTASGGYLGSGFDLFIAETNIYTGAVKLYPANTLPSKADTSTNVYEFRISSKFNIAPLVPLDLLKNVQGVGSSFQVQTSDFQPIADINQMIVSDQNVPPSTSQPPPSRNTQWLVNSTLANWDYPQSGGYTLLPGQVIDAETTVVVPAISSSWTDSGIQVKQGQRLAINVSSSNEWKNNTGGLTNIYGNWRIPRTANGFTVGSLIGRIGNGPLFYVSPSTQFVAPSSGEFYLMMNDTSHMKDALDQVVSTATTN